MIRAIAAWLVVAVAQLSGCSDLPAFDASCGNFVIDPGEDCDGDASGLCDADCNLRCSDEPTPCPDGYVCGADTLCHAPSGLFSTASRSVPLQSDVYAVTDVDQDGYGDVVSLASTSLDVGFGDGSADLSRRASTLTPRALGVPAFTHLDPDSTLDLLVPTANGIAGYSSQFQELSPHPVTIDLDQTTNCATPPSQAFQVFALHAQYLGVLTRNQLTGKLGFSVIDGATKSACPLQSAQICNIDLPLSRSYEVFIDIYADVAGTGKIIAVTLPQHGTCVFDTNDTGSGTFDIKTITPPAATISTRPVLARIRAGGCPSLIDGDDAPNGILEYQPIGTPGGCAFAAAATLLPLNDPSIPLDAKVIGHLPLSPAVAGHAPDALMLSTGGYAIPFQAGAPIKEVYRSDRKLDIVRAADLDLDGDVDSVGIVFGSAGLDILTRTSGSSFLSLRIATGPILGLELGDYDGNGAGDIAYAELEPSGRGRLLIAYGTRDRPLVGSPIGTFSRIVGMCVFQTPDSTDQEDIVDDLVVFDLPVDQPNRRQPLLSVLHGSPQRTMVSYFDPRTTELEPDDAFVGVVAGAFFPTPPGAGPLTATTDVIAVGSKGSTVQLWPLRGTTPGNLEFTSLPSDSPMLVNCSRQPAGPATSITQMCVDNARYLRWPAATHDVVLAIENPTSPQRGRSFAILDPTTFTADGVTTTLHAPPNAFATVERSLSTRGLHAADTNGDQRLDLIAAFGVPGLYDPAGINGTVLVCDVDANGVPSACSSIVDLVPELAGLACVDAAPADVAPRGRGRFDHPPGEPSQNLIVVCHAKLAGVESRLFRVYHDATGYHGKLVFVRAGSIERIEVGDVNGDGLDDVLALELSATGLVPTLLTITQCSSKTTSSCSP